MAKTLPPGGVARRLWELLSELSGEEAVRSTLLSVRMPPQLQEAMRLAADAGLVGSVNDGFVQGNVLFLQSVMRELALDALYAAEPSSRPSLLEVTRALAILDGNDVADRPRDLEQAVKLALRLRPDADAEFVLTVALVQDVVPASTAKHRKDSA